MKLDNGVLENLKSLQGWDNQSGSLRFADNVAEGENSAGFTSFTPNGVSRCNEGSIYKNNFGKQEDGDHFDYGFDAVPAVSVTSNKKKKSGDI